VFLELSAKKEMAHARRSQNSDAEVRVILNESRRQRGQVRTLNLPKTPGISPGPLEANATEQKGWSYRHSYSHSPSQTAQDEKNAQISSKPICYASTITVFGGRNPDFRGLLVGAYELCGDHHKRPVYRKSIQQDEDNSSNSTVVLYYHDKRHGRRFNGWWFGREVSGDTVYAYNPHRRKVPPSSGWMCPWRQGDGAVDETIGIQFHTDGRQTPEFGNASRASCTPSTTPRTPRNSENELAVITQLCDQGTRMTYMQRKRMLKAAQTSTSLRAPATQIASVELSKQPDDRSQTPRDLVDHQDAGELRQSNETLSQPLQQLPSSTFRMSYAERRRLRHGISCRKTMV
jgi:hypothetical protein